MLDPKEIHDLAPSLHIASQNEQLWIGKYRIQLDNTSFSDLNFEFVSDEEKVNYFISQIKKLPIQHLFEVVKEILRRNKISFFDEHNKTVSEAFGVELEGSTIQLTSGIPF